MIRLIHCADLHLDSPFSGLDAALSESRRAQQRELFRALICHAKNRRADLFLIAGDLFDSGFTSSSTVKLVAELLATLDCPVLIAPGNHDPYREGGLYSTAFPANVTIFTGEKLSSVYFPKINTAVHGYAFTSDRHNENPLDGGVRLDPSKINILCAHADLDAPLSKYAPITSRQIAESGFDYAALGHIHNPPAIKTLGRTLTAYSGCLEGRSFDELGYGGAIAVDIDGKNVTCERIRIAKQRYMMETLDITGSSTDEDTVAKIRGRIAACNYQNDTALRVILTGTLTPDYIPSPAHIREEIQGLYSLDIRDETLPLPDLAELERDMSIRGEYYRELIARMKNGDEEERKTAAEALRIGLCALDGKPVIL